jgi:hypothetical protein
MSFPAFFFAVLTMLLWVAREEIAEILAATLSRFRK